MLQQNPANRPSCDKLLKSALLIKKSKYLFVEWHNKPMFFVDSFIEKHLPMYEKYSEYEGHTFLKLKI